LKKSLNELNSEQAKIETACVDNLEKLKDRRPTQERLLKNGIKEFAM